MLIADATAKSLQMVGESINQPGGKEALKMKLIDQYIDRLGEIIEGSNVSIFPAASQPSKASLRKFRKENQYQTIS